MLDFLILFISFLFILVITYIFSCMFGLIEYFFIILNLDSEFPRIVNVLVRSHVSSCLWMVSPIKNIYEFDYS